MDAGTGSEWTLTLQFVLWQWDGVGVDVTAAGAWMLWQWLGF